MDVMERRKVNIMCVQETKWKGSEAKELVNGFKLFDIGEDRRRNGVGIIMHDGMKRGVLSVKRRSDRIIWVKVALNGEIINIRLWREREDKVLGRSGCRAERYTGHI